MTKKAKRKMGNAAAKQATPAAPTPPAAAPPPPPPPPYDFSVAEALGIISAAVARMELVVAGCPPAEGAATAEGADAAAAAPCWPPRVPLGPAAAAQPSEPALRVRGGWLPIPPGAPKPAELGRWGRLMADRLVDYLDVMEGLGEAERGVRRGLLKRLDALLDAADRAIGAAA